MGLYAAGNDVNVSGVVSPSTAGGGFAIGYIKLNYMQPKLQGLSCTL